jgi:uroporphyrinogen decarboxylase
MAAIAVARIIGTNLEFTRLPPDASKHSTMGPFLHYGSARRMLCVMTPRERVLAALAHEEPDRVPIDFGGHRSSGIAATAYARLKKHLGITSGDIYVYDIVQQLAIVESEVLDAMGGDVVELGRAFALEPSDWQPWVLSDGTPCQVPAYLHVERRGDDWILLSGEGAALGVMRKGCLYFEQTAWPWRGRDPDEQEFEDIEQALADAMWTSTAVPGAHIAFDKAGLARLEAGAKKLRAGTDRAILGIFGGNFFEVPQFLYGMDEYLLHLGLHPEGCERLSQALCDYYLERLDKWLGAVGPYIDVVLFGDDLGGQNGPLVSPAMYRRTYKPWQARLWRRAREIAPHVNIHLHSCGGIEPLLDDMIEAGLQSSNPVQTTCAGMDPAHLKGRFGKRFTFWGGGCDTRSVLPRGTPDEVRRDVVERIRIFAPGGGYVFQQIHNILADVPAANIVAMFSAAREARW